MCCQLFFWRVGCQYSTSTFILSIAVAPHRLGFVPRCFGLASSTGQVSTALAIARNLGKDATEEFVAIHSRTAWKQLHDFQIGVSLRPARDETEGSDDDAHGDDADEKKNTNVNFNLPLISEPQEMDDPIPTENAHPTPSWLYAWKRYSGGVTKQGGGMEGASKGVYYYSFIIILLSYYSLDRVS